MANLPGLPKTVALEGPQVEGEALEFIRARARENIEAVEKHPIAKEQDKVEFKKYVLAELEKNIKLFKEIDDREAVKKAQEEAKNAAEGKTEEKDPFADIFKDTADTPDEATQEKQKLAGQFGLTIKNYREKYLKDLIRKNEHHSKQKDEENLTDILGKLDEV